MNNLSWFIYLTQVVDNLGNAAGVIIGTGLIGGAMAAPFLAIFHDEYDFPFRKIGWIYGLVIFIAGFVAIFTPSRQTMIMIAGSEIGERIVKSEGVNSVVNPGMDLIRKWIKQESDKIKEKS